MKPEVRKLIKEFLEQYGDHPDIKDLTREEVIEIVESPWDFLKKTMISGSLDPVRIKYFGLFSVKPHRAKRVLKGLKTGVEGVDYKKEKREELEKNIKKFLSTFDDKEK